MSVIKQFAENFTKRDLEGVISLVLPDDDFVLYATEADEKRIGLEGVKTQLKRDWSQTEYLSFEYHWTSISSAGNVAWAAIDAFFKAKVEGHNVIYPARVTMIFEKRNDKWLIAHGHFSLPEEKLRLWHF
jgi:ketosteroid isomerase-like protein